MSAISALAGTTPTSQADKDYSRFTEDLDDFLNIFIVQLQNQDPLEPMEASEFVNQIANMSEVEQSINTNKRLENLVQLAGAKDNNALVAFIGKEVEIESQAITLTEGQNVGVSYVLDGTLPSKTFVTVRDFNGNVVFNGEGTVKAGRNNVAWDGTDNDGNQLEPGLYEVFVTVDRGNGKIEAVPTLVRGRVIGANLEAEEPTLIVNGVEIPMSDVRFVGEQIPTATI